MGIFYEPEKLNELALRETLKAAELLLPTYDLDDKSKPLFDGQSRMGFPASILLFCFIESVGHLSKDRKGNGKSFMALTEDIFGSIDITEKECDDLYKIYRNTLCHNLMLPSGFILDAKPSVSHIFEYAITDGKSRKIVSVNLCSLLDACKKALDNLASKGFEKSFNRSTNKIQFILKYTKFNHQTDLVYVSPSGIMTAPDKFEG